MDREHLAKAAVAGGIFILVVAIVFSFWFLLPSVRGGNVALAQGAGGAEGGPPGGGAPGAGGPPGMGAPGEAPGAGGPPGMGGPSGAPGMGGPSGAPGMGGPSGAPGMGGAPGGAAPGAAPAAGAEAGDPLEPSRANPFVPLDTPEPEVKYVTGRSKYGPDWSKVPTGYLYDLPQPEIPAAPPVPIPPNPTASADLIRISSIVRPETDLRAGAPGRAFATYEDPDGRTRIAVPGSTISVSHPDTEESQRWRVEGIDSESVTLRNLDSGEQAKMRVRPRTRSEQRHFGAARLGSDLGDAADNEPPLVLPGKSRQMNSASGAGAASAQGGMGQGGMGMGAGMGPGGAQY